MSLDVILHFYVLFAGHFLKKKLGFFLLNFFGIYVCSKWLRALKLEKNSSSTQGKALRVYTNFTAGSHTSLLDPTASSDATTEMQTQVANFLGSEGKALVITDSSVVE